MKVLHDIGKKIREKNEAQLWKMIATQLEPINSQGVTIEFDSLEEEAVAETSTLQKEPGSPTKPTESSMTTVSAETEDGSALIHEEKDLVADGYRLVDCPWELVSIEMKKSVSYSWKRVNKGVQETLLLKVKPAPKGEQIGDERKNLKVNRCCRMYIGEENWKSNDAWHQFPLPIDTIILSIGKVEIVQQKDPSLGIYLYSRVTL